MVCTNSNYLFLFLNPYMLSKFPKTVLPFYFLLIISISVLFSYCTQASAKNNSKNLTMANSANQNNPITLNWAMMTEVDFESKYSQVYKREMLFPKFSTQLKGYSGKSCKITGFLIPLDNKQGYYAISMNPYASCFFCGGSGPESVIMLKFKKAPRRFQVDEWLTIKGNLELNAENLSDLMYILNDAEEVK